MADEDKKVSLILDGKAEGLFTMLANSQKQVESSVDQINNSFGLLGGGINKVVGIIGIASGGLAGGAMFKDTISTTKEVVGEVTKLSKAFGITAQDASVFRVALDDTFNSADTAIAASDRLTRTSLKNGQAFKDAGIDIRDSNGNLRDSMTVMVEVNDYLMKLKEGKDRDSAAMTFYGKGWRELSGILRFNSEAMAEAKERADRLHLVFGAEGQLQVKEYKLAMKDLDDVTESYKVNIGRELIPVLTQLSVEFGEMGANSADGFAGSLREGIRFFDEMRIRTNDFILRGQVIGQGGFINGIKAWFTSDGREQIKKELGNLDKVYEEEMVKSAERYGNSVKAKTRPKGGDRYAGPSDDSEAKATEDLYKKYVTDLDGLNQKIAESNPLLDKQDKSMAAVYADVQKLADAWTLAGMPDSYFKSLNAYGEAMEKNIRLAEALKTAEEENADYLANNDPYQNYLGKMGTGKNYFNSDQGPLPSWREKSQQDTFDESAMTADWATRKTEQYKLELKKEKEFNAMRAETNGSSTEMQLLQIQREKDAWIQSWAMNTSSFEENERRKLAISQWAEDRRAEILTQSTLKQRLLQLQANEGYLNITMNLVNSVAAFTDSKNKVMFALTKGVAFAQAIVNANLAYTTQLASPLGGMTPIEREAQAEMVRTMGYSAAALIAAQSISQGTGIGSGGGASAGGYGGGTPSSPVVTQPTGQTQSGSLNLTIQIAGNVISDERWVEERLAPTIRDLAVNRSVNFGFAPKG